MKSLLFFTFYLIIHCTLAQETVLPPLALSQLDSVEAVMWSSLQNADRFDRITGADYITLNADGSLQNKPQTLEKIRTAPLPKAQVDLSEKSQRVYRNLVIRTGRAKIHKGGLLLTEFIFTETWIYRYNRWQFIGWQGTYSGIPAYYPVIITLLLMGLLALVLRWIGRLRRRQTRPSIVKSSL